MMIKSLIDQSRPHMLYASGLGVLMLLSLIGSNVPDLAFSSYFELPMRREVCAGLFFAGALLGAWALQRHMQRARTPWRVPQSQVSLPYAGFFLLTLGAIAIAH